MVQCRCRLAPTRKTREFDRIDIYYEFSLSH